MQILTRSPNEAIAIGTTITVKVIAVEGQQVRIGIAAPREVRVRRGELPPLPAPSPPHGHSR